MKRSTIIGIGVRTAVLAAGFATVFLLMARDAGFPGKQASSPHASRTTEGRTARGSTAPPGNLTGEMARTLKPADNLEAAARDALAAAATDYDPKRIAEASVRLLHWMRENPEAAFACLDAGPGRRNQAEVAAYATGLFCGESSTSGLIGLVRSSQSTGLQTRMVPEIGKRLGEGKSVAKIVDFAKDIPDTHFDAFQKSLAESWPKEGGKDGNRNLIELAEKIRAPALLVQATDSMPLAEAVKLIDGMLARNDDPFFVHGLKLNPALSSKYLAATDLPLEERIQGVMRFGGNFGTGAMTRADALTMMAAITLTRGSQDGDGASVFQKFGTGILDANQVYEQVRGTSELGETAPEVVRADLFKRLAAVDPERALALADGMDAAAKQQLILTTLQTQGRTVISGQELGVGLDARQSLALLRSLPIGEGEEARAQRAGIWSRIAESGYAASGQDYLNLVSALPPGPDRDLAIAATLGEIGKYDGPAAAEFEARSAIHSPAK